MGCDHLQCCCCCNDIHSCHASLIHAAAEIKFAVIPFIAQDWMGENYLKVIRTGTPGQHEVGPHRLTIHSYSVTVFRYISPTVVKEVNTVVTIDMATGIITLWKSSGVPAFSGRVEVR